MTTSPQRRWFRFSLRTMFLVVAIVGLLAWWIRRNVEQVRQRELLLEWASANYVRHGNIKQPEPHFHPIPLPITWRLLGAKRVDVFIIDPSAPAFSQEKLKAAFPESEFSLPKNRPTN